LVIFIASGNKASAQYVNMPDSNFKKWVLSNVPHPSSDTAITTTEAAAYKGFINIPWHLQPNITNITGLEAFINIDSLDCSGHGGFTSLDVSKNTALIYLDCSYNQLASLDVSKNTKLKTLSCSPNNLTSLDVSKNIALTYLICDDNPQLTSLDVSKNTALTTLYCSQNKFTSLDLSKNIALTYLNCGDNRQLTSLDVSKNTSLTSLVCNFNGLISLDVSKNTALTELDCDSNKLTSLDVSKNTALTFLDCTSTRLTNLDVSKNIALISLYCSNNYLTCIQVADTVYAKTHWSLTYNKDATAHFSLNCGSLPLTLLSFDGNDVNGKVSLQWSSANETNTSKFIIESSADGKTFATIGTVAAHGAGNYSFTDVELLQGLIYYRLKMVDKDGGYTYSKVVEVLPIDNRLQMAVFPNPAKDVLTMQVNHKKTETLTIQVIDILGRVLIQQRAKLSAGVNAISLAVTTLPKGNYTVILKGETVAQKGFVKE